MRCPICKREILVQDPCYPFCSERCKLIDLGNWASGRYVISTPMQPESEAEIGGDASGEDDE